MLERLISLYGISIIFVFENFFETLMEREDFKEFLG
jgi:hypothetical protein